MSGPFLTRRRFLIGAAGAGLGAGGLGALLLRGRLRWAGPYLQDARPDRVTVAAITARPERLRLEWTAIAGGGGGGFAVDPIPLHIHGLVAGGLTPATEYRYELLDEQGATRAEGSLRSAPVPGSATRFTFVAFGDSGVTRWGDDDSDDEAAAAGQGGGGTVANQWKVAAAIQAHAQPDLVLHTGDLVYPRGAASDYSEAFFDPFAPLLARAPFYPTLGNHDVKTGRGAPYLERFFLPPGAEGEERSYAFEWGDCLFVSFEATSSSRGAAGPLPWLEATLRDSPRTWKVVFFHVPPYGPCGRMDCPPLKEHVVPILTRNRVDLVLTGHDHLYARYQPIDGVTYVITGGGGGKLYAVGEDPRLAKGVSTHHFVEGVVEGRKLRLRAVGTEGQELDQVTLEK